MLEISRNEFRRQIQLIKQMYKQCTDIEVAMGIGGEWYGATMLDEYIDLLNLAMYGEGNWYDSYFGVDSSTLDFFIYDLDFGRKWKPGLYGIEDKDEPLRDIDDLFDALVQEGAIKEYDS